MVTLVDTSDTATRASSIVAQADSSGFVWCGIAGKHGSRLIDSMICMPSHCDMTIAPPPSHQTGTTILTTISHRTKRRPAGS